ncbi:hypothetical protein DRE_04485 [Drechslerella stenobrocha 248]|uniref:Uncharacterized protein n=1 Tax=Drechslerella stenobrocha 248 TaxID=1043628 RepID=W7HSS5_9PEZI|nr:hypothetical protein DRE_04485 [Drechslerella stenobrocha 248]
MSLLFVPRPRPGQFENSPCHYEPQDDLEYVPLTADALKSLAASLPQPISTVRYSNRENNYLFSDRESVYCPSLCSSPISATSSTRVSMIHTPAEGTEEITFDVAPISVPPERMVLPQLGHPAAKPAPKGSFDIDSMFDIGGDATFVRRNSTIDFLPEFDQIDDYVPDERTAARVEEERELAKARLLYEEEVEKDYLATVSRRPALPTSLWMSQPRHIMTPNFVPSPKNTILNIPVAEVEVGTTLSPPEYYPKSQTSFGSVETAVSGTTDLTVPSIGEDDYTEVDDEFVSTIFSYLSLNHASMARKFDTELAIGSGFPVDKVAQDRKAALKVYIERYVFHNPDVSL